MAYVKKFFLGLAIALLPNSWTRAWGLQSTVITKHGQKLNFEINLKDTMKEEATNNISIGCNETKTSEGQQQLTLHGDDISKAASEKGEDGDKNIITDLTPTLLLKLAEQVVPVPVAVESTQLSATPLSKSRKRKNNHSNKGKGSKKVTGQEVTHARHQPLQLPPPIDPSSVHQLYGRNSGIQLQSNSCYMDSTLFSMFSCTSAFDEVVLSPRGGDSPFAECVKQMLGNIVTRLRKDKFVSGDIIMRFRQKLVNEGYFTRKLLGTFMDPEEFFYILFNKALDLPRFFTYNTGHGDFAHQIFLPKSQGRPVATVQDLFVSSMKYSGDLKLERVPDPALIILMPRSKGALVGYEKIIPSLQLDLTEVMTGVFLHNNEGDKSVSDSDLRRNPSVTATAHEFTPCRIRPLLDQNLKMKLVAVVCVSGYHYTSFVRCGEEWMYFDSMGPSVYPVDNCSSIISRAEANLTTKPKGDSKFRGYSTTADRMFRDCQYCIYEPQ